MEFRRANRNDLAKFLENRMEFVASISEISDTESFRNATRQYLEQHIHQDDLIIYIALDGDQIVSSCMACIYQTAPVANFPSGRCAELLNVYTVQAYRRNGYAERLIRMLIQEARNRKVGKILLDYTKLGLPLYKKLGFTPIPNQMELRL